MNTSVGAEIQRAVTSCGTGVRLLQGRSVRVARNTTVRSTMMTSFSNCQITVRFSSNQVVYSEVSGNKQEEAFVVCTCRFFLDIAYNDEIHKSKGGTRARMLDDYSEEDLSASAR